MRTRGRRSVRRRAQPFRREHTGSSSRAPRRGRTVRGGASGARVRETKRPHRIRIVGRGENAWSREMSAELRPLELGGIIAADLGVRAGALRPATPTILIDHHVPTGEAGGATVITGFGKEPIPTSSLLAFWCASSLMDVEPWLWIAAIGLVGDMAEASGFPEMERARGRFGLASLREATALLNAARRSARADATPALELLLKAESPRDLLSARYPEVATLHAARAEVKAEFDRAKRIGPVVRNGVALILFHSACQIHPLVAQAWRARLKDSVVLVANTGYRAGWVHFSARSARDMDLVTFLAEHAPAGADENYGSGHKRATGGALRIAQWNAFVESLGFGAEGQVHA